MLTLFVVAFIILGYMGMKHPDHTDLIWFKNVRWAQLGTLVYFAFFVSLPFYSRREKTKPVPERVTFK
jgi:ubiquinol-cytochrome c reductase cytochrome b subunit